MVFCHVPGLVLLGLTCPGLRHRRRRRSTFCRFCQPRHTEHTAGSQQTKLQTDATFIVMHIHFLVHLLTLSRHVACSNFYWIFMLKQTFKAYIYSTRHMLIQIAMDISMRFVFSCKEYYRLCKKWISYPQSMPMNCSTTRQTTAQLTPAWPSTAGNFPRS